MSMDLSPADYVLRALPRNTVEFPIIVFSLVGIIGTVLAYATIFSEDGSDAPAGIDFTDFGIEDLGFSDPPRSDDSHKDDSYDFGFGADDAEDDPYRSSDTRGGSGKSKRRKRNGGCGTSSRRRNST